MLLRDQVADGVRKRTILAMAQMTLRIAPDLLEVDKEAGALKAYDEAFRRAADQ